MENNRKDLIIWAAGFFDGEGSVFLRKSSRGSFTVRIAVGQVNPTPIRMLLRLFGGHISQQKPPKGKDWKPQWRWEQDSKSAVSTLEELLPHLKVKLDVALLAIEFQKLKKRGQKFSKTKFQIEKDFKEKISFLNHKD